MKRRVRSPLSYGKVNHTMEISDIRNELEAMAKRLENYRESLNLTEKEARIAELENEMTYPDFWDNQEKAQKVIDESNALKAMVDKYQDLANQHEDGEVTLELIKEEPDAEMQEELGESIQALKKQFDDFELEILLNGPYDANNAILELHPGAGGTESQDWASMLLRMYQRFADKQGWKVETIDYLPGEEAGVKSVTLRIIGHNAYGYLKAEKGSTGWSASRRSTRQAVVTHLSYRVTSCRNSMTTSRSKYGQRTSGSTRTGHQVPAVNTSTRRTLPSGSRTCRRASSFRVRRSAHRLRTVSRR